MNKISHPIRTFIGNSNRMITASVADVRQNKACKVRTYSQLISKLAHLAYENPDLLLLMRGQAKDYGERGITTLYPSIYRMPSDPESYNHKLAERYATLSTKERALYESLQRTRYADRVARSELARWAILQHYEVCPTPLLDVTHSALVACSFAFLGESKSGYYHLFVLGVPQISGSITVSAAQAIQIVRLSGVCPPETLRPYYQEGYLIGSYPSVVNFDEKKYYRRDEMDCAVRLVAKFRISTAPSFWDQGYQHLPQSAVYPTEHSDLAIAIAAFQPTAE